MILTPSPISSSRFTYSKGTFVAEVSDLRSFNLGRVYDDARDVGFTVISEKTGKPAVFALEGENKDREGDFISWLFRCVTPGLTNLKAEIFND